MCALAHAQPAGLCDNDSTPLILKNNGPATKAGLLFLAKDCYFNKNTRIVKYRNANSLFPAPFSEKARYNAKEVKERRNHYE